MQQQIFIFSFILCILFNANTIDAQKLPKAPNYQELEYWAAHPNKKDWADYVPKESDFEDKQATAIADVFYIHPTTALSLSNMRNARLNAKRFNNRTDFVILNQATVFNGSCRVFAPRYRQVTLISFLKKAKNEKRTKVFNLAYSDVKAAFEHYLKHENQGRPIIIAGHSQGSYHGLRLLKEFFDGKPLFDQLVAAYLLGPASTVPMEKMQEFEDIAPARSASGVGKLIAWNSYKKGGKKYPFYVKNDLISLGDEYGDDFIKNKDSEFAVINPLNWKANSTYAPDSLNIGATRFVRKPEKFEEIDEAVTDAQLLNGVLRISKPNAPKYKIPFSGDFHIFDYNLFYSNIRKNVALRLENYFKQKGKNNAEIGNER